MKLQPRASGKRVKREESGPESSKQPTHKESETLAQALAKAIDVLNDQLKEKAEALAKMQEEMKEKDALIAHLQSLLNKGNIEGDKA